MPTLKGAIRCFVVFLTDRSDHDYVSMSPNFDSVDVPVDALDKPNHPPISSENPYAEPVAENPGEKAKKPFPKQKHIILYEKLYYNN